jgi:hypothetical protein
LTYQPIPIVSMIIRPNAGIINVEPAVDTSENPA